MRRHVLLQKLTNEMHGIVGVSVSESLGIAIPYPWRMVCNKKLALGMVCSPVATFQPLFRLTAEVAACS